VSWQQLPFDHAAVAQSDKGRRIKQRDYLPAGAIPVIDQGQEAIGGYTDDAAMTFDGELPVILFGDHTRAVKLVSQRFAVGADGIKIFRPADGVRPKYLYYWMKSAPIPDRGYGRHYQYLRQLVVPVPSPTAQDGIVAEIEKQFSRLDEAVAGFKRVKANLKRYKAAVLKSAVTGRLVPTESDLARREGRNYETGAQLLQRILETRRSQWQGKGKYKEPAAPDTTGLPELPEGWTWSTADQMCSQITDGEHIQPRYKETGFPMLTAKNVRDGFVDFGDVGYIAESDFEACLRRCAPVEGDLLIVSVGATTGRSAIVARCEPFALVRSVLLLRPVSAVLPNYILCWLQSPWCQTYIQRASGATAQAHLYIKDTRTIPVPSPPLAEQHRIVAEVDRLLSIAREAEVEVEANLKRAQGLRQAILARAFQPGAVPPAPTFAGFMG
jgi:type I restriction enzyme, S subunit